MELEPVLHTSKTPETTCHKEAFYSDGLNFLENHII